MFDVIMERFSYALVMATETIIFVRSAATNDNSYYVKGKLKEFIQKLLYRMRCQPIKPRKSFFRSLET